VTNNGPSAATGVALTDPIPAGLVPASVTPGPPTFTATALTCNLGTLAPNGGSATVTLVGTVEPSVADLHELENTATVTDEQGESATAGESAKVVRTSGFAIAKTAPGSVTAGESATWTIKVANKGPSDYGPPAEPLVVTDAHSAFLTLTGLTSSDPNVTCSGATSCAIKSLAAGKTVTITATGLVHSDASGTLHNKATVETPT
jgi:hypothetical protein